ncbi:uncharacterized protein [Miscanthus floridulus]|uniref:uncharacterized protein n=1 Tax=Miscanthus floridulus TaxID=154761 RepID=UPI003457458B
MEASPLCYQNVRYKLKDSIHTLSTKAAGFLKISIINLYHRHMPDRDDWDSHKRKNIGQFSSNPTGKPNPKDKHLAKKVLIRSARSASRTFISDQDGQLETSRSNIHPALFQKNDFCL